MQCLGPKPEHGTIGRDRSCRIEFNFQIQKPNKVLTPSLVREPGLANCTKRNIHNRWHRNTDPRLLSKLFEKVRHITPTVKQIFDQMPLEHVSNVSVKLRGLLRMQATNKIIF